MFATAAIPKLRPEREAPYDHRHKIRRMRTKGCSDRSDQDSQARANPNLQRNRRSCFADTAAAQLLIRKVATVEEVLIASQSQCGLEAFSTQLLTSIAV